MPMYIDRPCEKCGTALTHVYFKTKFCETCKPIAMREKWNRAHIKRQADPERRAKRNEQKRKHYHENRDVLLDKIKKYRHAHPDMIREQRKRYAEKARLAKQDIDVPARTVSKPKPVLKAKPAPKPVESPRQSMTDMLKAHARKRLDAPRADLRTVMPAHLEMQECPRLHVRSTSLPCGVDMALCGGCPKCNAA